MRNYAPRSWLLAATLLLLGASGAQAATIAYWRMEADLDPSANGFQVANEVASGTSLFSSEAFVDTLASPTGTVPLTGAPNFGSAGATIQGGPNGINATAAWYAALDVSSITVEFWARTVEGTATLFSRSSGNNGIVIANPNSLDISYWVEDGLGGATRVQLLDVFNMNATWHHFLFSYDELTGIGRFVIDGTQVARNNGPDNRALVWGNAVPVRVGTQMDFAAAFNGTLDEVRIMDQAPSGSSPTLISEPAPAALAAAGLLGLLALGRRRRA